MTRTERRTEKEHTAFISAKRDSQLVFHRSGCRHNRLMHVGSLTALVLKEHPAFKHADMPRDTRLWRSLIHDRHGHVVKDYRTSWFVPRFATAC